MVKYLKLLLWPFALLYSGIMALRNLLYNKGILHSVRFDLPVIVVGNLTVGGTGKTPHVEYLLRLLHTYKTATLSRGYKRKSKGFIMADAQATAATLGDEPFQYYRDFPGVTVAVSEDRVEGISKIKELVPDVELILLDDAFQHRPVQASFQILLTDFTRLFYKDYVLPAGLLRESKYGARRSDVVIVTKCPEDLSINYQESIEREIRRYTKPGTPVFFSTFGYGQPVAIGAKFSFTKEIVLLTGIANATPLAEYLKEKGYTILQHLAYPDHHTYTSENIGQLKELMTQPEFKNATILTTRKDAVKLQDAPLAELTSELKIAYIPIEVVFLNKGVDFDNMIKEHVANF